MHSENAPEDKGLPNTNISANEMQVAHLSDSATIQQREDGLKEEVTHEGTFTSTLESNGASRLLDDLRMDQPEQTSETVNFGHIRNAMHETAAGENTPSNHSLDLVDGCAVGSLEEAQFAIAQPPPNMTSSANQEPPTTRAPAISANYSPMQSPSSDSPISSVQPPGTSSNLNPSELRTFVSLSTSSPETLSLPSSPDVLQVEESRTKSDSGRSSPYLLINKDSMADASKFEMSGLLYARSTTDKHNRY